MGFDLLDEQMVLPLFQDRPNAPPKVGMDMAGASSGDGAASKTVHDPLAVRVESEASLVNRAQRVVIERAGLCRRRSLDWSRQRADEAPIEDIHAVLPPDLNDREAAPGRGRSKGGDPRSVAEALSREDFPAVGGEDSPSWIEISRRGQKTSRVRHDGACPQRVRGRGTG